MELKATRQVDTTQESAFAALTNFDRWQSLLKGRVASMKRTGDPAVPLTLTWKAKVSIRNAQRDVICRVSECRPHHSLILASDIGGLHSEFSVQLSGSAPTTLDLKLNMSAGTLKARAILASLKLARSTSQSRFDELADRLVQEIERQITQA